ncbi:MAG: hypothetical protein DRG20_03790 [Deltaproteobacteria bacterium]|nr:outer membrane lipoprotein carrier protein LolA [Deltaproteobacteria bacterium]RLA90084.1 MAG: hypothetical protein DRG20_03790 [Deltaproteobacteria bacterium]
MRRIFIIYLISFLLLFLNHSLFSNPLTKEEIVRHLLIKKSKITTFVADITQEKEISLLKEKVISKGKIFYKSPSNILVKLGKPESLIILLKKDKLLLYYPLEKVAEKYNLKNRIKTENLLFPFSQDYKNALSISHESTNRYLILIISPSKASSEIKEVKLWIEPKNWMIKKMKIIEKNGDTSLIKYSNMVINEPLSDSIFSLKIPDDVEVSSPLE